MDKTYMYFRTLIRKYILDVLGAFSSPANGIHILNGHRIQNSTESPDTFRSLLNALSKEVQFIRIEEAADLILNQEQPNKPLVAFTFDDGFEECYTHYAPILEEYGINGLFFINPNFVNGDDVYIKNFTENIVRTPGKHPMTWEQIKDLQRRGFFIGAHTMDHYMINTDDIRTLEYQIVYCKKVIEEELGTPCDYFAFPYGRLEQANKKSIEIALHNYKYVFSQSDYKHYFSFDNKVINRRHFEAFWPLSHVNYFLSCHKKY